MTHSIIQREALFGAQNYRPLPVVLTKGEGIYVWDDEGNRYIDMMSAYSAVSHGHCHPKLIQVLKEQAEQLNVVSRSFYTNKLADFLERACQLSGFDKALPMNTGAEAVETALKAARKWAYLIKGVPSDQAEIIVCRNNFHGRTIAIISMSTDKQYRGDFGPFTPGFKLIPYGDEKALEAAITPNTAAFLMEPIQGEGGIIVPPSGYLKACQQICHEHRVLFICDEIQTGLGRTGKLFAFQHEEVKPDGLILGKALGGGILPVSLFLSHKALMDVFKPGDHGSTFGGNPLAAAIGKAALDVLLEEKLSEKAAESGRYFLSQLKTLSSPLIKDIRGRGLLIGLELTSNCPAYGICLKLLKEGILTKDTHQTVIRFAPPLMIGKKEIDVAIAALQKVLAEAKPDSSS